MSYFYEEILNGLTHIPVYGQPGVIVIPNDKSQAVFTANSAGEVFIAAAKYGNGKIFVCAHDKYYDWLDDTNDDEICKAFMNNVKKWLTNLSDLSELNVIDVEEIVFETFNPQKYQMVKWCQDAVVSDDVQAALLNYLNETFS